MCVGMKRVECCLPISIWENIYIYIYETIYIYVFHTDVGSGVYWNGACGLLCASFNMENNNNMKYIYICTSNTCEDRCVLE